MYFGYVMECPCFKKIFWCIKSKKICVSLCVCALVRERDRQTLFPLDFHAYVMFVLWQQSLRECQKRLKSSLNPGKKKKN